MIANDKDANELEEKKGQESADLEPVGVEKESAEVQAPHEGEQDVQDEKEIREEIENTDLDDSLKSQVQDDTNNVAVLEEEKKIKHLLALAEKKGVIYAVKIAKDMDDPYLLDKFHDLLIEKGYYKQFAK